MLLTIRRIKPLLNAKTCMEFCSHLLVKTKFFHKSSQVLLFSEVLTQEFKWNPDAGQIKIAQALKKVAKFLTVYNTYVTEHDKLSQAILHAIEKHANLREFFEMHIGGSLFYELKVKLST